MKAEDSAQFREAILKEINSFKKEQIFELNPLNKLSDRSLILFVWSFKHKRKPMRELIKYKARLCIYRKK